MSSRKYIYGSILIFIIVLLELSYCYAAENVGLVESGALIEVSKEELAEIKSRNSVTPVNEPAVGGTMEDFDVSGDKQIAVLFRCFGVGKYAVNVFDDSGRFLYGFEFDDVGQKERVTWIDDKLTLICLASDAESYNEDSSIYKAYHLNKSIFGSKVPLLQLKVNIDGTVYYRKNNGFAMFGSEDIVAREQDGSIRTVYSNKRSMNHRGVGTSILLLVIVSTHVFVGIRVLRMFDRKRKKKNDI